MQEKQREEFGKFYFDLAKLVFAGIVLFNITEISNADKLATVFLGIGSIVLFVMLGLKYLKN